jgi:hypothetical protein
MAQRAGRTALDRRRGSQPIVTMTEAGRGGLREWLGIDLAKLWVAT